MGQCASAQKENKPKPNMQRALPPSFDEHDEPSMSQETKKTTEISKTPLLKSAKNPKSITYSNTPQCDNDNDDPTASNSSIKISTLINTLVTNSVSDEFVGSTPLNIEHESSNNTSIIASIEKNEKENITLIKDFQNELNKSMKIIKLPDNDDDSKSDEINNANNDELIVAQSLLYKMLLEYIKRMELLNDIKNMINMESIDKNDDKLVKLEENIKRNNKKVSEIQEKLNKCENDYNLDDLRQKINKLQIQNFELSQKLEKKHQIIELSHSQNSSKMGGQPLNQENVHQKTSLMPLSDGDNDRDDISNDDDGDIDSENEYEYSSSSSISVSESFSNSHDSQSYADYTSIFDVNKVDKIRLSRNGKKIRCDGFAKLKDEIKQGTIIKLKLRLFNNDCNDKYFYGLSSKNTMDDITGIYANKSNVMMKGKLIEINNELTKDRIEICSKQKNYLSIVYDYRNNDYILMSYILNGEKITVGEMDKLKMEIDENDKNKKWFPTISMNNFDDEYVLIRE